jgi:ADP-ribose pyrophosphatase YjhB (NUDIX family)
MRLKESVHTQQSVAMRISPLPAPFQSYQPLNQKVYGCICISPQNRILLVKGRKGKLWSFPKGHREKSDRTSLACALRELKEETGISLRGDYTCCKKYKAAEYFIFEVSEEYRLFPQDTREIEEAKWLSYEDICLLDKNIDVSLFCQHIQRKILPDLKEEELEDPLPQILCS